MAFLVPVGYAIAAVVVSGLIGSGSAAVICS